MFNVGKVLSSLEAETKSSVSLRPNSHPNTCLGVLTTPRLGEPCASEEKCISTMIRIQALIFERLQS